MARTVMVSVSGMVGAGKSSGQSRILRALEHAGVPGEVWRFRTLPCFSFPFGSSQRQDVSATKPAPIVRGRGYRRKPLTLSATVGYIGRMTAFRAYRWWRQPAGWTVCNRYFYDNLAHFDLDAPGARKYVALLQRLMPRPDLAILFVASPAVIAERRPLYSVEYLEPLGRAYSSLTATFPELMVVNTDPGGDGHDAVDRLIAGLLRRR
jgi:hypothetical protein